MPLSVSDCTSSFVKRPSEKRSKVIASLITSLIKRPSEKRSNMIASLIAFLVASLITALITSLITSLIRRRSERPSNPLTRHGMRSRGCVKLRNTSAPCSSSRRFIRCCSCATT